MAHTAHDVFRPTDDGTLVKVDTVFASYSDPDEMKKSLIDHDGYPSDISVRVRVSPTLYRWSV